MSIQSHGHEHEFEPQYGLPERLPEGERILWQGSPDAVTLARQAFHLRKIAAYFGVLAVVTAGPALWSGATLFDALATLRWLLPMAALGLASVALLAWLTARTTVYTLTDRRVVMRLGIVLTVTFNLPLRTLGAASLRPQGDGHGDISLALAGPDRIAYLHLWPSVRPWRLARPEPMLRCVADAPRVAALLQQAWSHHTGGAVASLPTEAAAPAGHAGWQASPV